MSKNESYKIRPAGRHLLTIGRDLIQDQYAAVVELVKNSFDADSSYISIEFSSVKKNGLKITIEDNGHGMTRDDVVKKWLVPSTDNKRKRKKSPMGRIMQGNKGVGRYAAAILGSELLLETVTPSGEKTTSQINWRQFEQAEYLDEVEVKVDSTSSEESSGTRLIIFGSDHGEAKWNELTIRRLNSELKKLVPPIAADCNASNGEREFEIILSSKGLSHVGDFRGAVEPYPVLDLYNYRISGSVTSSGKGVLEYCNSYLADENTEVISFNLGQPTGCGDLRFDIRAYDREPESIDILIAKGLKAESGNIIGRREARKILDNYSGIGVYRNGFRIRPLGDNAFDWLELNKRRYLTPARALSGNQVIGYVFVESEGKSNLIEKSARDGLKENAAFASLKEVALDVLSELESRRFSHRVKSGASRSTKEIGQTFESIFSAEVLEEKVSEALRSANVSEDIIANTARIIKQDSKEKIEFATNVNQAMMIYQRYTSLGKIVETILHEAKRPLGQIRNQAPNLKYWISELDKEGNKKSLDKIVSLAEGMAKNGESISSWFVRLDPLFVVENSRKRHLNLTQELQSAFSLFEGSRQIGNVTFEVRGPKDLEVFWWPQDFYAVFTNLIENSLYWISKSKIKNGRILIEHLVKDDELIELRYSDNGPGINQNDVESEAIFELEFSTKPSGTGLGLTIAREAAFRNGHRLNAEESEKGALFSMTRIEDRQ